MKVVKAMYDEAAESSAPPQVLWALLRDARTWPRWGTVDELLLERSEHISPDGRDEVGAVRISRTGKTTAGERITELRQDGLFGCEDALNPIVENYRAQVLLAALPSGGTAIRWRGTYQVPFGVHLLFQPYLARVMRRMARGPASDADS